MYMLTFGGCLYKDMWLLSAFVFQDIPLSSFFKDPNPMFFPTRNGTPIFSSGSPCLTGSAVFE